MMQAAAVTSPPTRRHSRIAAASVPPVASRSSSTIDALSRRDRVGLDLDRVAAVFEIVGVGDGRARQLAALAHHDEAAAEAERERRGDEEAARFDADEQIRAVAAAAPPRGGARSLARPRHARAGSRCRRTGSPAWGNPGPPRICFFRSIATPSRATRRAGATLTEPTRRGSGDFVALARTAATCRLGRHAR